MPSHQRTSIASLARTPRWATVRRSGTALAAALTLIVSAGCGSVSFRRLDFDTTEQVRITAIRLLPGAGDVVIRADGDPDQVRIKRVVRYQGNQPATTYEIKGGELVLDTSCGRRCSVSYEVIVGKGVQVEGETGSGNIDLSSVGRVEVKVGSGNVRVAGAAGAVRVETGSGEIQVYDVSAPVVLRAGSGNIDATGLRGEAQAQASSGNVTIELAQPASARAHTSSGNVELRVPAGAYQVRTEAGSGEVEVGIPNDPAAPLLLDVRTGSGNITIMPR
ncbi:DUF4097 family beta strand repeat-containing protein [Micromonospora sp. NPDC047134]|uniref:DUF4097 family beta strand repeat-containing protein n=1 Tax=Micromonospora sp. NPDC047134 TaxID=3154340 RepID=UPI0034071ECB